MTFFLVVHVAIADEAYHNVSMANPAIHIAAGSRLLELQITELFRPTTMTHLRTRPWKMDSSTQ